MEHADADTLLATIGQNLGLTFVTVRATAASGRVAWRVIATDAAGERWTAEHADYGQAALLLAEMVGFDVMDR